MPDLCWALLSVLIIVVSVRFILYRFDRCERDTDEFIKKYYHL